MNLLKILVMTIAVVVVAVIAAPFALSLTAVAVASSTPQGRAAIGWAYEMRPERLPDRMKEAMKLNEESARNTHNSIVQTDYSRSRNADATPGAGSGLPQPAHQEP